MPKITKLVVYEGRRQLQAMKNKKPFRAVGNLAAQSVLYSLILGISEKVMKNSPVFNISPSFPQDNDIIPL